MRVKFNLRRAVNKISEYTTKLDAYVRYLFFEPHYPFTGIEISEDYISVMKVKRDKKKWLINVFDKEELPDNVIKISPLEPNIMDMESVIQILRNLWTRNKLEERNVSLLIPDKAIIVFVIKIEKIASKKELNRLIQWKLRKNIPFPVEETRVSWMPLSIDKKENKITILVSLIKKNILEQYEKVGRSINAEVSLVDIPFFSFFNYLMLSNAGKEDFPADFLVINSNGSYITLGLFNDRELSLYKCRSIINQGRESIEEYEKEILKELHPLIMYYFDQLQRKDLQCVFLKSGNDAIKRLLEKKYGFRVIEPRLLDEIKVSDETRYTEDDLGCYVPLIGLLLGRRIL